MTKTRRRGVELEKAIFQATREILATEGLAGLTFPKVAAAAGTSKPVIYRRWKSPFELSLAAVQDQIKAENNGRTDEVVFTGDSLREDLMQVMKRFVISMNTFGQSYVTTFFSVLNQEQGTVISKIVEESSTIDIHAIDRVLERAQTRGEITTTAFSNDLKLLPFEWLRYHVFTRETIGDDKVKLLVDDILVPAYRHAGSASEKA
ncbi:TetR/AcrR family transcriptional regulator [Lactiplantibacillus mudanjiangensis]|uniref:TetR family transcriptional regulator [Lactobacillus hokkaidonensis JCM] n=1 Tax=Lactiplantibacillus mudanjiangensis TaxID=1296538 RepID=A0A660DWM9_9LACO|nr:TetR/AcrR family transcriptional regulator [Lactiplantibacillus mudanjiangensis]VDG18997.1 TetR family transcriptional regulator [Lactobacillus hokkaidonensis JCM] [Lactiplantibacillus mudanjiangensis]VDG25230.1 TetR family transcriptional regulator [Lactobacillus hokkaidonensis JCM] [Lactiplantibacillus mudanjiangensis]VDG27518.1 TetR family transcriptional regulator [Lactobacillus hokkaidonensis JCM] [Lactiplantibacillus mudanjiangensis]VDG33093.1 TetR family transcriptional regulator [Lac